LACKKDLLSATDAIFARWRQKKVEVLDSNGTAVPEQGGYGPDRQWFAADGSGKLQGTIRVFAEDGETPLATGSINLNAGKAYTLVQQETRENRLSKPKRLGSSAEPSFRSSSD
jgi:hypothetical protein